MPTVRLESRLIFAADDSRGPYAINTWHVKSVTELPTLMDCAERAKDAVMAFFTQTNDDDLSVQQYMPEDILTGEVEFRYWDADDDDAEVNYLSSGSLTDLSSFTPLPTQLAICTTTKCEPYGGHRRQSFYNRQYIGPWSYTALGANGEVLTALAKVLTGNSADDDHSGWLAFIDELDVLGPDTFRPVVYSKTHHSSGPSTDLWVDNRWDVQRRRALAVTARTSPGS